MFTLDKADRMRKTLSLSIKRVHNLAGGGVGGCGASWPVSHLDLYNAGADPMSNLRKGDTLSCRQKDSAVSLWANVVSVSGATPQAVVPGMLPVRWTILARDALPSAAPKGIVLCWIDRFQSRGARLTNNTFAAGLPGCGIRWKPSDSRIADNAWVDSHQTRVEITPVLYDAEGPLLIDNVTVVGSTLVNSSWWHGRAHTDLGPTTWAPPCLVATAGTSQIACGPPPAPLHVATCHNASDCTDELQAALASGAAAVHIPRLPAGRSWVVRPLKLHSNQRIVLAEGVEILAKRGEFQSPFVALLTGSGVQNVSIVAGAGAQIRMHRRDYANGCSTRDGGWDGRGDVGCPRAAPALNYSFSEWRHGM
jgi:hypothetical protein